MRIPKLKLFILFFVSILLPGLAHFLLKHRLKAIVIVGSYVFHLLLILSIYQYKVLQIPLTIVTLMVALCAHYFYSVFDALQLTEENVKTQQKNSIRLKLALILVACWGGAVIMSFFIKSLANPLVLLYPYTFLMFTILYLVTHLTSHQLKSIYVGRWTAIVCLSLFIFIGLRYELLWQQLNYTALLLIVVTLFGLECSTFYLLRKLNKLRKHSFKLDFVAIIAMVIFSSIFLLVPKYGHLPSELLKSFHMVDRSVYQYDNVKQIKYQLQPVSVSPAEEQNNVTIVHRNGLVKVQSYDGEYIKVEPFQYEVDQQAFQDLVDETNRVNVTIVDEQMKIETMLAQFEGHISKMDIMVYIPFGANMDELSIEVEHGKVQLENVKQFDAIYIDGREVNVDALHSSGNINVHLTDGDTYIYKQNGTVIVRSRAGHIMLHQILKEINAETLNGNILIMMKALYESIHAHAGVGSVQVSIPSVITYNLDAKSSFGTIGVNGSTYENEYTFTTPMTKKHINIFADQNIVLD